MLYELLATIGREVLLGILGGIVVVFISTIPVIGGILMYLGIRKIRKIFKIEN